MATTGPKPRLLSERLLEKLSNLGGEGCWLWNGSRRRLG